MSRSLDDHIVDRLLARDEGALREVISAYGGAVYGMARRVVAEPTLAQEVAQDVFVALWRRPGAFDPQRGSLRAFLMGVARNKAVDLVRREEAHKRAREALISDFETGQESDDETVIEGVADAQDIRHSLQRLSTEQREAIVLAYFGGRTYREVALELGIPEGTAKTRLRDGMRKLRDLLVGPEGMA